MADVVYTTALDDAGVRAGLARMNGEAEKAETNWNQVGRAAAKMGAAAVGAFATANTLLDAYGQKHDFAAQAIGRHRSAWEMLQEDIGRDLATSKVGNTGDSIVDKGINGVRKVRDDLVNQLSARNILALSPLGFLAGKAMGVGKEGADQTAAMKKMEDQAKTAKQIKNVLDATRAAEGDVLAMQISSESDPIKKNWLERRKAAEDYNKAIEKINALEAANPLGGPMTRARQAEAEKFAARDRQLNAEQDRLKAEASAKALQETGPGRDVFEQNRASKEKLADEQEEARIAVLAALGREKEARIAGIALTFAKQRREVERDMALTDQERAAALEVMNAQQQGLTAATEAQFRAQEPDRSRSTGVSGAVMGTSDSRLAAVLTMPVDREAQKQTRLLQEGNGLLRQIAAGGRQSILN